MNNSNLLEIVNKLGNITSSIEGDITLNELIDSGIFNDVNLGRFNSNVIGPYNFDVGDSTILTHEIDTGLNRNIYIYIVTDKGYVLDDINNYIVTFDKISKDKTIVKKIRDSRNVTSKPEKTLFVINSYNTKSFYSDKQISLMNNIYLVLKAKHINDVKPNYKYDKFLYCIETKTLYEWDNAQWVIYENKSNSYADVYAYNDKHRYIEYNFCENVQPNKTMALAFMPVANVNNIVEYINSFNLELSEISSDFIVDKTLNSITITNTSDCVCSISLGLKVFYEDWIVHSGYKNLATSLASSNFGKTNVLSNYHQYNRFYYDNIDLDYTIVKKKKL